MRDLKVDRAIIEAATAGPWFAWVMMEAQATIASGRTYGNVQGPTRVFVDRSELFAPGDAKMIALSREAWPHAIDRAEAAEMLLFRFVFADEDNILAGPAGVLPNLLAAARALLEGKK